MWMLWISPKIVIEIVFFIYSKVYIYAYKIKDD